MGLREKALDFTSNTDYNLALTPQDRKKEKRHPALESSFQSGVRPSPTEKRQISLDDHDARLRDIYVNILELVKEISQIEKEADLLSTSILTLIGFTGIMNVAVFIKDKKNFILKEKKGYAIAQDAVFSIHEEWLAPIYKEKGIIGKENIQAGFYSGIIMEGDVQLIVPVLRYEELIGIVFLDKKIGNSEFNAYDLVYLKIFGEIIGLFYSALSGKTGNRYENLVNKTRLDKLDRILRMEESLSRGSRDAANISDIIRNTWENLYPDSAFLLIIETYNGTEEAFRYRLHPESLAKADFARNLDWYGELESSDNWLHYPEFKDDDFFYENMESGDWNYYQTMQILPFHQESRLKSFVLMLNTSEKDSDDLFHAGVFFRLLTTYFQSKKNLDLLENNFQQSIQDPFYAVKSSLKILARENPRYSLVFIQFANARRIETILNNQEKKSMQNNIARIIQDFLQPPFFSQVMDNEFLFFLPMTTKTESWQTVKKIQRELSIVYPDENFRPLIKSRIHSFPEDGEMDLSEVLFHLS